MKCRLSAAENPAACDVMILEGAVFGAWGNRCLLWVGAYSMWALIRSWALINFSPISTT